MPLLFLLKICLSVDITKKRLHLRQADEMKWFSMALKIMEARQYLTKSVGSPFVFGGG